MLIELRISQLAIVDELAIPFGPGLTVITGETGAGKSVIAGAIGLLCGRPVPKDLVREGEECAWVEGVFDLSESPQAREGIARAGVRIGADGVLVLRRELRLQGRSRVLINGLVSSLALLEQIGPRLLTVQSQDQQRELSAPDYARDLLDELAGLDAPRDAMRAAWERHREAAAVLAARRAESRLAAEQLDLWRWQLRELETADPRPEEEEELAETLAVKRHAGVLQAAGASALRRLEEGESPALDGLRAAVASLRPQATRSQRLAAVLAGLEDALRTAGEASEALRRFLEGLDDDAAGLDALEARRALYEDLKRKYGRDTSGLIALRADLAERVARQDLAAGDLSRLEAAAAQTRAACEELATRLHDARLAAAGEIARSAEAAVRPLALGALEVAFDVELREDAGGALVVAGRACAAGPDGADRVRLRVRTNRGERMGDVAGIASGGERSRIHLGLTALRRADQEPPLLLCDETDAGLGMDSARPVAALLRGLAARGQVLCITHLATMAVHGDDHLRVAKSERGGRTRLAVARLGPEDRVEEVARLLGGEASAAGAEATRFEYARALLAGARRPEASTEGLRAGRIRG